MIRVHPMAGAVLVACLGLVAVQAADTPPPPMPKPA